MNRSDKDYVYIGLCLFVALYASKAQIKLPRSVRQLFSSSIFRVVFLALLAIYLNRQPHVALIVAIVFVLTLTHIGNEEMRENFEYAKILLDDKKSVS